MRFKYTLPVIALFASTTIQAQQSLPQKSWFTSFRITDFEHISNNAYALSSQYYFAPQESSGTLDDWGYIDTDSNVSFDYAHFGSSNPFAVSGEYFMDKFFAVGGLAHNNGKTTGLAGVGYLFADNLKTSVMYNEDTDDTYLTAQYQHDLNSTDYLGFTANTDVEFDSRSVSARYFALVNNADHVTVNLSYSDNKYNDYWSGGVKYYFGQQYSLGLGAIDSKLLVEADYFFSNEYYVTFNYLDNVYQLALTAQF
ncbi:putative porin (plasmid) [Pseudoalteromonas xiamenensis]|uniref:putative porin n=1 Tax=Pseudoalteromonas xiamenensis TaxID=882626 RepID=UPI0027E4A611|nr:putative porin [Pseudoalteromonas xiamenensis]WMN61879.1 putative porin [Pseudoalteromonas xiamenensis]